MKRQLFFSVFFATVSLFVLAGTLRAWQAVSPHIILPVDQASYIFGEPVSFHVTDDTNSCHPAATDIVWYFRSVGEETWETYQFTTNRLLGTDRLIPLPGHYEVKAEMCGVQSAPITFHVDYRAPLIGEEHPIFADLEANDHEYSYLAFIDWHDIDAFDNHRTTAHFNVFWDAGDPVDLQPSDQKLGILECTWATLSHWMTSPLDDSSIYRHYGDYDPLTHITVWAGGVGGAGISQPQGLGYQREARNADWVPVHELFHVFDYAGNPLHNKPWFDYRYEANPYHFFHEAPTGIEQTMARDARKRWGYRSDVWPVWMPLDLGLLELDYQASIFWTYLINTYGFTPRLTWEGPSIDACAGEAQLVPPYPPHNFKLFEAWNGEVRRQIRAEIGAGAELAQYGDQCPPEHRDPDPDKNVLYNGEINPPCSQTLEYELSLLEDLTAVRFPVAGLPLEESLQLDFAVKFAQAFPPVSLLDAMPAVVTCNERPGIGFAHGFQAVPDPELFPNCPKDPPIVADAPVCDAVAAVNDDDFYARIKFKVKEPRAKYLRVTANDDATVYVDGKIVIGEPDPTDLDANDPDMNFPNASTTYADQRQAWNENHAPVSSVFPIRNPTMSTFEIEWVNRGDGLGNADGQCNENGSRYLLMLEWYNPLSNIFTVLDQDQLEVLSTEFWPSQGSGYPGFSAPIPNPLGDYDPINKEIQLRSVGVGEKPFLLPSLGIHYHSVQCPVGYTGDLEVTVRDDQLTHTQPSVHLMVLKAPNTVEWRGPLPEGDNGNRSIVVYCNGVGGPASFGGDPAFLLVTTRRTLHGDPPVNPYGTLGAIHYTVMVTQVMPVLHILLPMIMRDWQFDTPLPTPIHTSTSTPMPSITPTPTATPTPTGTRTFIPSATSTALPLATNTPTFTPTSMPINTPTNATINTPTVTQTPTATTTPAIVTLTLAPIADAYIYAPNPTTNYGAAPLLYVGSQSTSAHGRALFRFELSIIPANATIQSASFEADLMQTSSTPPSLAIELRRIDATWAEMGLTWTTQPNTSSIGKVNGVGTALGYYGWDVTGLVQEWHSGVANNGFALVSNTEGALGWRGFASRENAAPPLSPPHLVISYRP